MYIYKPQHQHDLRVNLEELYCIYIYTVELFEIDIYTVELFEIDSEVMLMLWPIPPRRRDVKRLPAGPSA